MVVFDPTVFSQVEALRRLQGITLKMEQRLNALNIPSSRPGSLPQLESPDATIAPLNLPLPEEALTPILKLDASDSLRTAIRAFFTKRLVELQLKCINNYRQTCISVAQTMQPARNRKLQDAYLNFYRRQCHSLVEAQLPYLLKELFRGEQKAGRHGTTKSEFNHEYIPVLESYFAYNAYPPLPDRLLLARKSMMTPRQIEVWFQNHRNRAKKDGVTLQRISPHTASTFAFDAHIPQSVHPSRSRSATADLGSSDDSASFSDYEATLFNDHRPAHAFPASYMPKTGKNPFSVDGQTIQPLSRNQWMRSPTTHTFQHSSTSVDDLADLFARMSIRGPSRPSRGSNSATKQRKRVTPLVAVHSIAPHPAILNPGNTFQLSPIRTADSCTWQKPSLCRPKPTISRSKTSYPSWAIPDFCRRRKSPGFSRRLPSSPCNSHHLGASPRTSSASSSASSSTSALSRSTSITSFTSEPAVDLPGEFIPPDVPLSNFVGIPDYVSADHNWSFNASSEWQYTSPPLPQDAFPDQSQALHISGCTTMDVPGFMFFQS